jgi:hypothetical protein
MTLVRNTLLLPGGDPPPQRVNTQVRIQLIGGGFAVTGAPAEPEIIGQFNVPVDSQGVWEIDLIPNSLIAPVQSYYRVEETAGRVSAVHQCVVPAAAPVISGSRTSNVVTVNVGLLGHGINVGDTVIVNLTDDTYDGTFTVTAVSGTLISWSQVAANDVSSGSGTVEKSPWNVYEILVEGMDPNPAFSASESISKAEAEELLTRGPAGFIRSMDPKATITPVISNSVAETSVLNATFKMPKPTHETVVRFVAFGVCRCTAGGPVNLTFRLKNVTDTLTYSTAVVTLATDTQGNRPWRFRVDIEGNTFLAGSVMSVGDVQVGAGDTDTIKQGMNAGSQSIQAEGSDPQNWDVTVQASVANAGIQVYVYSAQVLYALAGV